MQNQWNLSTRRPRSALAGVKHQIYHPRLPTLRRMDMDTVLRRLPGEHSRQTTLCSKEDFNRCYTVIPRNRLILHCQNLLNASHQTAVNTYQPVQQMTKRNHHYRENWSKILQDLKSMSPETNDKQTQAPVNTISGYAQRRRHPDITSSWQHTLAVRATHQNSAAGETQVQWSRPSSSRPMPATIYSRYRSSSRPCSAYPWH